MKMILIPQLRLPALTIYIIFFCWSLAHSTERNPLKYYTLIQDANLNTPSHRIHASSRFDLEFKLHGGERTVRLTLAPNNAVIQDGATVQYMAPDGSLREVEYLDRNEYRVFMGDAWIKHQKNQEWINVGWARIIVLKDGDSPLFEGVFRIDGDHHHIQTKTHYMQTRHKLDPVLHLSDEEYMVVWRDSDIMLDVEVDVKDNFHAELKRSLSTEKSCSSDRLSFNTQVDHPIYMGMTQRTDESFLDGILHNTKISRKRQLDGQLGGNSAGVNLVASIGSTAGCPTTRKVALVGVATDCSYTAAFNSTAAVRANIISVINSASQVYESSFNITLGLQNLTISDPFCPSTPSSAAPWNLGCNDPADLQDRLNLFSAWRGARKDNNAYWTLLSTCGSGSAVGLAWLGQVCVASAQISSSGSTSANETVSGANVVVRTGTEWQVIAHETGHTFGAVHDCTVKTCSDGLTVASQQCCPLSSRTCDASGSFIMNPNTGPNIRIFSPCTIGNICSAIGRNSVKTSCLTANKDVATITGSQCGNGIVESGEDCDCGGAESCGLNSCCDPATCKFKGNAVCDPSNEDCCSSDCQLKPSGTVCRQSTGTCDPEEMCSGTSATCPQDSTAPEGTKCGDSPPLFCASGQCTSRDLQCKTLMGVFTQGNDTYACSSSGCQISCASPEFGLNVCYSMQQNFLDGTPCQGGGMCVNGQCSGASVTKEIKSWVAKNRLIVIVMASAFCCFFVLMLLSYCIKLFTKNKRSRKDASRNITLTSTQSSKQPSAQGWATMENRQHQVDMWHNQNHPPQGWWGERGNWVRQPPQVWQNHGQSR